MDRREWFAIFAGTGIGTAAFQRALAQEAAQPKTPALAPITVENIAQAEWISGITLTEDERKQILAVVRIRQLDYASLRKLPLPNSIAPAVGPKWNQARNIPASGNQTVPLAKATAKLTGDDLAFAGIQALAGQLQQKHYTSVELCRFFLERLKTHNPTLKCVVTLCEESALKVAAERDKELAQGKSRGLLHGLPYGLKDLVAYPGYPTTWGAKYREKQTVEEKATVADKLDAAGGVLLAKLSLGALAMGDQWFGGMTRNPWNSEQGSSGSSAGSASAVSAGLVPFAIGSETLGSIVSPSVRCGTTGLRPTFGRVSRHGCMALSWSMDKIGPIARSVADCEIVFAVIQGEDGKDPYTVAGTYTAAQTFEPKKIRVGFPKGKGDKSTKVSEQTFTKLGFEVKEVALPTAIPARNLLTILTAEAAAAFDDLTREAITNKAITESLNSWPNTFREGEFIPAVEYLRAQRHRSELMKQMEAVFAEVDVLVNPNLNDLVVTNLTGHPQVVLPSGFVTRREKKTPEGITMTAGWFQESVLMFVAGAWQTETGFHLPRPKLS